MRKLTSICAANEARTGAKKPPTAPDSQRCGV
jgi:hypothetical protein